MNTITSFLKKIIPASVFRAFQPMYHWKFAFLSALWYRFPSRRLTVIGITGTDGKSSVVWLLHSIFRHAGFSVASASSLRFAINEDAETNLLKMTMPGRFFMQRFLRHAVNKGVQFAILEVTSEGIKQFRHTWIRFSGAGFTNVTPEHIESHGSFESYRAAKGGLFAALSQNGIAVLNRDDGAWDFFAKMTNAQKNFYSREEITVGGKIFPVRDIVSGDRISFSIGSIEFRSPLFGVFNVSNLLCAITVAHSFGIPFEQIAEAITRVHSIPGRLEVLQQEPFRVVVDYAHTPNALRSVYETLRRANPKPETPRPRPSLAEGGRNPKLVCVFGAAGGGRDKWKRAELGKIAGELCGEIILTNEDPYDENPATIVDEIEAGFSQVSGFRFQVSRKILDRREAIRAAIHAASPGDTVVITGKGAEQWIMGPEGVKIPWDDRAVVSEEIEKIRK